MSDTQANILVKVTDAATGILGNIGKAMGGIALAAGAAALTAGVASVKLASDFQATMNDFSMAAGSDLGKAGMSAEAFQKKFMDLGAATKYSAQEAAAAGVELVKGGVSLESVMGDATAATLNLASATKSELAPTARVIAQQLGVWADQGANATATSDMLAQALNASTLTTLDDLALGLANVNGVAKASGVSQADVVQAMAATSKGFATAADQGTAFKSMLQAIAGPSSDAKGAMRELGLMTFDYAKANQYLTNVGVKTDGSVQGINSAMEALTKRMKLSKKDAQEFFQSFEQNQFYDSEGKFKGMGNAAEILKKALSGLSDQARSEALKDIFGSDGVRMATALAETGADGFNAMGEAMKKAGTSAEMAAKLNKGFGAVMESITGSVENVGISFGLKLLPALETIGNKLILPLVNGFGSFVDSLDFSGFSVESLSATIEGAMPTIEKVVTGAFTAMGPVIETAKNLFWTIVGAATNVYNAIVNNWPQISATAGTIFTNIGTVIGKIFNGAVTVISNFVAGAMPLVIQIGAFLIDKFNQVLQWINANWPLIQSTVATVLNAILLVANTVWPAIKLAFNVAIEWILGIVKAGMQFINGDWAGGLKTLQDANDRIWNLVKDFIGGAVETIRSFVAEKADQAQKAFTAAITQLKNSAVQYLVQTYNAFTEKLGDVIGYLGGLPTKFYELGKNIVFGLINAIVDFGETVKTKIIEMIMGPLGYVKNLLGIHSPSDETEWIGLMTGMGYANGIQKSIKYVEAAMDSLHQAVIAPAFAEPQGTAQVNWAGASYGNGAAGGNNITSINLGGVTVNDRGDADYLLRMIGDGLLRK